MPKFLRFTLAALFAGAIFLAPSTARADDTDPNYQDYNYGPGSGGGGNCTGTSCEICRCNAQQRYNRTIEDTCNSFPVNLFGWTRALCYQTAQNVLAQDLVNCVGDNYCN